METRLSDFAIASRAIEILCHKYGQDFVDLPVAFVEGPSRFENGVFYINPDANLDKTIFSLFFLYLKYLLPDIPDDAKADANRFFLAIIKDFKNGRKDDNQSEVIQMRLNQFPAVWLMLKNIICPLQNIPIRNFRVMAGHSGKVDVCRYLTEIDMKEPKMPQEVFPFIFLNLDVESKGIQSAYMLVEALRGLMSDSSHGSPEDIIRALFSDFLMKDKMTSFVKMVLSDEREEANFFGALSILCRSTEIENLALAHGLSKDGIKEAQSALSRSGPWWFMGLTEKMLEPARSEDWTVRETLKPFAEELWDKVERERKRRGMDEVPFEMLLRIQSEDLKTDETKTLQALLSNDRIW